MQYRTGSVNMCPSSSAVSLSLPVAVCAAYKSLRNLKSLHTSLTSQLDDVLQLTHIKLYHTATYLNLNVLAASLPHLRCLEGLPFRNPSDPKNYWPLRQCRHLEKLVMQQGCVQLPTSPEAGRAASPYRVASAISVVQRRF